MESQLQPRRQVEQDINFGRLQDVEGAGHDEHHEQKSILKKVKAKAKRIKDTLKLHGHNPEHNHDRDYEPREVPDDYDSDEEDDGDNESRDDLKIHQDPGRLASDNRIETECQKTAPDNAGRTTIDVSPAASAIKERRIHEYLGLEEPASLEEDPHAPSLTRKDHDPSNYQTKTADPTGVGHEAGCGQIVASLSKMTIRDDPKLKTEDEEPENQSTVLSSLPNSPAGSRIPDSNSNPGGYTGKIYSTIADTAESAKNILVTKLGIYPSQHQPRTTEAQDGSSDDAVTKTTQEKDATNVEEHKNLSVKEYIAEKFRPRAEDRALSQVIFGGAHKTTSGVVSSEQRLHQG